MRIYDILAKKKNGGELTKEEIFSFVEGVTDQSVPDYQIAAFTMAVCIRGMTDSETFALTEAMASSGDMLDLSRFGEKSADKHSTGGVGDKTSLICAPIAAALGCKIAKMSGRGLGHTGGTVDKLEAVRGYTTAMSEEEFITQADKVGIVIAGQTAALAPADKRIYAVRDVTATVDSIPLIASSIMSKKLAAGAKNIVLDVKVGSGAFMKTRETAEELAGTMVRIGERFGRRVRAVITDMDKPLGCTVGNLLEVAEAAAVLRGEKDDSYLREVSLELAANMVSLANGIAYEEAHRRCVSTLGADGLAIKKFGEWLTAQHAEPEFVERVLCEPFESDFFRAAHRLELRAPEGAYGFRLDAERVGEAAVLLGAGREKIGDIIAPCAGIELKKEPDEPIVGGDIIAELYSDEEERLGRALEMLRSGVEFEVKA